MSFGAIWGKRPWANIELGAVGGNAFSGTFAGTGVLSVTQPIVLMAVTGALTGQGVLSGMVTGTIIVKIGGAIKATGLLRWLIFGSRDCTLKIPTLVAQPQTQMPVAIIVTRQDKTVTISRVTSGNPANIESPGGQPQIGQ